MWPTAIPSGQRTSAPGRPTNRFGIDHHKACFLLSETVYQFLCGNFGTPRWDICRPLLLDNEDKRTMNWPKICTWTLSEPSRPCFASRFYSTLCPYCDVCDFAILQYFISLTYLHYSGWTRWREYWRKSRSLVTSLAKGRFPVILGTIGTSVVPYWLPNFIYRRNILL